MKYFLRSLMLVLPFLFSSCNDENFNPATPAIFPSSIKLLVPAEKTIYRYVDNGTTVFPMITGDSLALSYSMSPDSITYNDVKWSTSDASVATVSSKGVVTARGSGSAIITVTPVAAYSGSGISAILKIVVSESLTPAQSISLSAPSTTIFMGESVNVSTVLSPANTTYKTVRFSSSDESIATVNNAGVVTGVTSSATANQNVTITATALDPNSTVSQSIVFTVRPAIPLTGISLTDDNELSQLGYGENYQLQYSLIPSNATAALLTWTSSDTTVVKVDKNGYLTVTSKTGGSATITASYKAINQSKKLTVVAGRFCYSFAQGLSPWFLDTSGATSSYDGTKTTVAMGPSGAKFRADFDLVKNGSGKTVAISPSTYPILAFKVRPDAPLIAGTNSKGTIKLEIYDSPTTIGYNYLGSGGSANNAYTILGQSSISTTSPNVVYFDLTSKFDTQNPADRTKLFNLVQMKFVIADFPAPYNTYDVYWVRSFKSVSDLQTFVNNE